MVAAVVLSEDCLPLPVPWLRQCRGLRKGGLWSCPRRGHVPTKHTPCSRKEEGGAREPTATYVLSSRAFLEVGLHDQQYAPTSKGIPLEHGTVHGMGGFLVIAQPKTCTAKDLGEPKRKPLTDQNHVSGSSILIDIGFAFSSEAELGMAVFVERGPCRGNVPA